jgi:hypothetical protein
LDQETASNIKTSHANGEPRVALGPGSERLQVPRVCKPQLAAIFLDFIRQQQPTGRLID